MTQTLLISIMGTTQNYQALVSYPEKIVNLSRVISRFSCSPNIFTLTASGLSAQKKQKKTAINYKQKLTLTLITILLQTWKTSSNAGIPSRLSQNTSGNCLLLKTTGTSKWI